MHSVFPPSVQHFDRVLPLPHSQHADAKTYEWHALATHTSFALQALLQEPQWVGSLVVSAQAERLPTEHWVSPEPQPPPPSSLQDPPLQVLARAGHTLVHEPQWLGSS